MVLQYNRIVSELKTQYICACGVVKNLAIYLKLWEIQLAVHCGAGVLINFA